MARARKNNTSGITVKEAGQRGGTKTRQLYGEEFYEEIGRKGGTRTSEKYGPGFYQKIGKKGGQAKNNDKE